MSCRACCTTDLALPDDFNPLITFQATDKFLFVMNCPEGIQIEDCRKFVNPGFVGVTPDQPQGTGHITICNDAQTAFSFIGGVLVATVTISRGTYCVTLNFTSGRPPAPGVVSLVLTHLNDQALNTAQAQADQEAGSRLTCNAVQNVSGVCPDDGTITATATIPAGSICSATLTQDQVNGKASVMAANLISSIMDAEGCNCLAYTDWTARKTSTSCPITFQLSVGGNLIPPPNVIVVNSLNFDWDAFYFGLTGDHLHGHIKFNSGGTIPDFFIDFPP